MSKSFRNPIAIGTIAVIAAAAPGISKGPGPERAFPVERLAKKIGLSDDQVAQFRSLEDRTMKSGLEVHGRVRFAEHELQRMIRADQPDKAAIFAKIDEIAALHAEQRKLAVSARLEGRTILTDAQREQVEQLIMGRGGDRKRGPGSGFGAGRGDERWGRSAPPDADVEPEGEPATSDGDF